jgi:hypothetical protein
MVGCERRETNNNKMKTLFYLRRKEILLLILCIALYASVFLGRGIYALVIAFPSRKAHLGTLIHVRIREDCDSGCSWRVVKLFQKGTVPELFYCSPVA